MPQPLDGLKCLGTVGSIASRAGLRVNNQTSPKRSWLRSWCISQPSQKVYEGMNMMPFCSVWCALLVSLSWTTDGNATPVIPETSDSSFRQDQLSWASDLITISIRLATCPYTSSQRDLQLHPSPSLKLLGLVSLSFFVLVTVPWPFIFPSILWHPLTIYTTNYIALHLINSCKTRKAEAQKCDQGLACWTGQETPHCDIRIKP